MIKLLDKPNTITTDPDFPYGKNKDTPNGSLANTQMFSDLMQFAERLMALSGITPNGLLDNSANGYQLMEALYKLVGMNAWTTGPTITASASSGTVTLGTAAYNRYKIVGKTLYWELDYSSVNLSATPNEIYLTPNTTIANFVNTTGLRVGNYGNTTDLTIELNSLGDHGFTLRRTGGANFTTGSGQRITFLIVAEIS